MPPDPTAEQKETAVISTCRKLFARRSTRLLLGASSLLTLTVMLFGVATPDAALAWDNCPKGLVNDPYPGRCGRYVDTNGDDICDLSQRKPVASTTTTLPLTTTEVVTTSTTDTSGAGKATVTTVAVATTAASGEPPTGGCPLGPCVGCRACVSIAADVESESSVVIGATGALTVAAVSGSYTDPGTGSGTATSSGAATQSGATSADTTTSGGSALLTHYLVTPIAIAFFLIYATSFILYKTKRMQVSTHRKIWNVLLLGTFLVTGIFGVILAIQIDYTLPFTIPINLLFWHVEAGIAMTLISLFHLGWHFNYYKNLVRNTRTKVREARAAERAAARRPRADEGLLTSQAREERRARREAERTRRLPAGPAGGQPAQPRTPAKPNPWIQPEIE
jgi:hypothetical protein